METEQSSLRSPFSLSEQLRVLCPLESTIFWAKIYDVVPSRHHTWVLAKQLLQYTRRRPVVANFAASICLFAVFAVYEPPLLWQNIVIACLFFSHPYQSLVYLLSARKSLLRVCFSDDLYILCGRTEKLTLFGNRRHLFQYDKMNWAFVENVLFIWKISLLFSFHYSVRHGILSRVAFLQLSWLQDLSFALSAWVHALRTDQKVGLEVAENLRSNLTAICWTFSVFLH